MKKKLFAIIFTAVMLFAMVIPSFAAEQSIDNGKSGSTKIIIDFNDEIEAEIGTPVSLTADLSKSGTDNLYYKWWKGDTALNNSWSKPSPQKRVTPITYTINKVGFADAGTYTVKVGNTSSGSNAASAVMTLNVYAAVTFMSDTEVYETQKVFGGTATAPVVPAKDGYDFTGWFLDGEIFDFETPITESITLTAGWEEIIAEFSVTVNFEGFTGVEVWYVAGNEWYQAGSDLTDNHTFVLDEDPAKTLKSITVTAAAQDNATRGEAMRYTFNDITLISGEPLVLDVPVQTITVNGYGDNSISVSSNGSWPYESRTGDAAASLKVFDNGQTYTVYMSSQYFYDVVLTVDETWTADFSDYIYDIIVPEGVTGVWIHQADWAEATNGKITVFKNNQAANLYFTYDGVEYRDIAFKLDGSNPFDGMFIVNFPGFEGVTMQSYKGTWSNVSGTFANYALFIAPGATSVRAAKGGMTYQVNNLGKVAYPYVIDVPAGTITVEGIGFDCNLSIVGSDWVYQNIPCAEGVKTFDVFGGRNYELRIAKTGFHNISIPGLAYNAEINVSEYFYSIEIPEGVTNLRMLSNNWIADYMQAAISPGKTINLLKTGKSANVKFNYDGKAYNVDFVLDGVQNPFDKSCEKCGGKMVLIETRKATCEADGAEYFGCTNDECNHWEYGEITKALGHNLVLTSTRAATCEADGAEYFGCINEGCNHWEYGEITKALGHALSKPWDRGDGVWFVNCTHEGCTHWNYADAPALFSAEASKDNIISITETAKNIWTVEFTVTETDSYGNVNIVSKSIVIGKNSNGKIDLGAYTLTYDIKGNGSNVKAFNVEMN